MTAVTVIGVGADGATPGDQAQAALAGARLVVGAARHLAALPVPEGCEQVALGRIEPAIDRLRAHPGPAVVLASGDPGFFGIVRALRAGGLDVRVLPAVSSVAAAFAQVGLPWDGATVVSAHGRDLRAALNACRALPMVAVLTAPGAGAAEIGAGLSGWLRRLVVAECLGTPDERVVELSPEEAAVRSWQEPHAVLVLRAASPADDQPVRADNQPAAAPAAGWALPETAYAHRDSMITKAEVRALVVARLRPRLGRLIWDVGAGSGSVGIECATLGAAVVAVEHDAQACAFIRRNATAHHAEVRVVEGRAPDVLRGLPGADGVFVGGGGLDVLAAVVVRAPARVVVALAAVDRVAPAVHELRTHGYAVEGVQLAASRLADLPGGSIRLEATNPVTVLTGELS